VRARCALRAFRVRHTPPPRVASPVHVDGLLWVKRDPEVPIVAVRLFSDTDTAMLAPAAGQVEGVWTALGREDSVRAGTHAPQP
jgi:hypothetical protein